MQRKQRQREGRDEAVQQLAELRAPLADYIMGIPTSGAQDYDADPWYRFVVLASFTVRHGYTHVSPRLMFTATALSIFVARFATKVLMSQSPHSVPRQSARSPCLPRGRAVPADRKGSDAQHGCSSASSGA